MKNKLLVTLIALVCAVACVFGLVGCVDRSGEHTHNWSSTYMPDETVVDGISIGNENRHYQTCDGCGEKKYGDHDFSNGDCICGKKSPVSGSSHTMTYHAREDAGCEDDGTAAYWYCSECEKYFADEQGNIELETTVIPATGHKWNSGEVTTPNDCNSDGVRTFECENCNETKTETISAAHAWGEWQFLNDDLHIRTCEKCKTTDETSEHYWDHNSCETCDTTVTEFSAGMKYAAIKQNDEIVAYSVSGIGTASDTDLVIPDKHNGLPVVEIEPLAFTGCNELTSVLIPDSVEYIGYAAFGGCSALQSMTLPFVGGTQGVGGDNELFGYIFGDIPYEGGTKINQSYNTHAISSGTVYYYIPTALKKITVTRGDISYGAFSDCKNLTEIVIADGITHIGAYAFKTCSSLTKLEIPDSITYVGNDALQNCNALPYTTHSYGTYFGSTANPYYILVSVTDTTVKSFTAHNDTKCILPVFDRMENLTSLSIPNGVTSVISPGLFYTVSNMVTRGAATLRGNGVYIGNSSNPCLVLYANRFNNTDITIQSTTKIIATYALSADAGWDTLTIPDSVQYIGENNFCGGYGQPAKTVSIGSGVVDLEGAFFRSHSVDRLTAFSVSKNNKYYSSEDGVLFDKDKTRLIRYPASKNDTTYTIPSTVKTISPMAFYGNKDLQSVKLPDGLLGIGAEAFYTSTITSIEIPDSVKSIGACAFSGCGNLASADIGDGVKSLDVDLFYACRNMTEVNMGNNVVSIHYSFPRCKFTSIEIPESVRLIGYGAFGGCEDLTSVTIPYGVTAIGDYAFNSCYALTSITIPGSVTTIGEYSFHDCPALADIYYVGDLADWCEIDGLTNIMNPAMSSSSANHNLYVNGKKLTGALVIPDGVTAIAPYAFYGCTDIMSVTISDSVKSIGRYAFEDCSELTTLTIGDGVATIEDYAFYGCGKLTSVTVGSGLRHMDSSAFYTCNALSEIHYTGNLADWCKIEGLYNFMSRSAKLFVDGQELTGALVIPDGITSIANYAFRNCRQLTSLTIGDGVTTICNSAFESCRGLTSITISASVTTFEGYAFAYCTELTSINFNGTKEQWNAITKESSWDSHTDNYTVHCTDGDITKS